MYVRPTPFVLKQWEKAGGPQWSPENATRSFQELENYHGQAADPNVRSTKGRLSIRQNYHEVPGLVKKLVSSYEKALGYPEIQDYNDPKTPVGPFSRWQLYQYPDGRRASASAAFLSDDVVSPEGKGANGRQLTVKYQATAAKVLFDNNKRAKGVRYIQAGETAEAIANKKAIVCAGLHSTQLLMLSGIGPREVLEAAGVETVYANPNVGAHLADDSCTNAVFSVNPKDIEELAQKDPNAKIHSGAFLPAPGIKGETNERSIQIMATGAMPQALYFSILCVNPKSCGNLKIQSSDPLKIMLGDFGFLTEDEDVETLMAALRAYIVPMARELEKADPAYKLLSPSPDVLADDQKLRRYVIDSFIHTYHDQCALPMGTEQDGVVDGWGEVYGVKDLVVADAPSSHTTWTATPPHPLI